MRGLCSFVFCIFIAGNSSCQEKNSQAQAAPAPSSAQAATQPNYPDKPAGLEKLVKEIFKAEKDGDAARVDALAQSLVLPDPNAWYETVFGQARAGRLTSDYEKTLSTLPRDLAASFRDAYNTKFTGVIVERYDRTCDDKADELIYPVLAAREQPAPLYEIRLSYGNSFKRIWAFAYVNGAFRFFGALKPPTSFSSHRPVVSPGGPNSSGTENRQRIIMGAAVTKAQIIKQVPPSYPERARREYLQGKIVLHAIIAKDGSVQDLQVIQGQCILAEAAIAAVKQWVYRPTMINGIAGARFL